MAVRFIDVVGVVGVVGHGGGETATVGKPPPWGNRHRVETATVAGKPATVWRVAAVAPEPEATLRGVAEENNVRCW